MEGEEAMVIHILPWLLWFCGCPSALASAESAGRHWRAEMTITVSASECTSAWKSSSALPQLSGHWCGHYPLWPRTHPDPAPSALCLCCFLGCKRPLLSLMTAMLPNAKAQPKWNVSMYLFLRPPQFVFNSLSLKSSGCYHQHDTI